MKKTLSNLKQVNHFIQETEEAVKKLKANKALTAKEKDEKKREHNTHLNRLIESKITVLENLKIEVTHEIETLTAYLN
jgi:hypothetical protein